MAEKRKESMDIHTCPNQVKDSEQTDTGTPDACLPDTVQSAHPNASTIEMTPQNTDSASSSARLIRVLSWFRNKCHIIAELIKKTLASLLDLSQAFLSRLFDILVNFVLRLSKMLGKKLQAFGDQLQGILRALAHALSVFVHSLLDTITEKASLLLDAASHLLEHFSGTLKNAFLHIAGIVKKFIQNAFLATQDSLHRLFILLIRLVSRACALAGITRDIFNTAVSALRTILQNPGTFFATLKKAARVGLRQFRDHLAQNLRQSVCNLAKFWFHASHISFPDSLNIFSLIKFVSQCLGLYPESFLSLLNLEEIFKSWQIRHEDALVLRQKHSGANDNDWQPDALPYWPVRIPNRQHLVRALQSLSDNLALSFLMAAPETLEATFRKLNTFNLPANGLSEALQAIFGLIRFIQMQVRAFSQFATAAIHLLHHTACGKTSEIANAVEALFCQLIPLAVDLVLRLCGINISSRLQKLIITVQEISLRIFQPYVAPFKRLHVRLIRCIETHLIDFARSRGGLRLDASPINRVSALWGKHLQQDLDLFQNRKIGTYPRNADGYPVFSKHYFYQPIVLCNILEILSGFTNILKGNKCGTLGAETILNQYELERLDKFNDYRQKQDVKLYVKGKSVGIMDFNHWSDKYDTLYQVNVEKKRAKLAELPEEILAEIDETDFYIEQLKAGTFHNDLFPTVEAEHIYHLLSAIVPQISSLDALIHDEITARYSPISDDNSLCAENYTLATESLNEEKLYTIYLHDAMVYRTYDREEALYAFWQRVFIGKIL